MQDDKRRIEEEGRQARRDEKPCDIPCEYSGSLREFSWRAGWSEEDDKFVYQQGRTARLEGKSLADMPDFVFAASSDAWTKGWTEEDRHSSATTLPQRDPVAFVEALLNAPAPNTRLQKAAQRIKTMEQ